MTSFLGVVAAVAVAGAIGGLLNALLSDTGFKMPATVSTDVGRIWQPGWIGNLGIGIIGAVVSYLLYGPVAGATIIGGGEHAANAFALSAGGLGSALLVGVAGSRWITAEVERQLFKATADTLSTKPEIAPARRQEILAKPAGDAYIAAQSL